MIYRRIARRYAAALFATASEQRIVDRVVGDLRSAHRRMLADSSLRAALAHPEIPSTRKQEIIRAVFAGLAPLSLAFLDLLVQRRRQPYLGDIIEEYQHLADAARGVVRTQVVSAVALTDDQRQRLHRTLERRTGKTVEMRCEVDPGLLAGLMVMMNNEVIDVSARGRLEKLRELLAGARFRGLGQ